ncbi:MAG: serine/threonine-protein kinase [Polyangiales bacterium]
MPIPTDSERIGTTIDGKYKVESLLGKGGMGTVFRATHTWTGRAVALKVLQPQYAENDAVVLRFLREARAAASFRHPNVVEVLDMGSLPEGGAYMALAFLEGEPLSAVIDRRKRLTVEETFAALVPVMRALSLAHSKGIVHRDLKPDNLFLARNDEGSIVPTLLDFGIAKIAQDQNKVTTTGVIFGTPHYMSPEQARGVADIDGRADQWSIAAVWFECLTGDPPFDAPVPTAIIARLLSERAPRVMQVRPSVPLAIAACVDRALEPDRDARFPSMDAFVEALIEAARKENIDLAASLTSARRGEVFERTDEHRSIEGAKTLAASEMPTITNPADKRPGVARWSVALGALAFASVVTIAVSQRANQAHSAREPVMLTAHDASASATHAADAGLAAVVVNEDASVAAHVEDSATLAAHVEDASSADPTQSAAIPQRDPTHTTRVPRSTATRDAGARATSAQSTAPVGATTNAQSNPQQTIGVSTQW